MQHSMGANAFARHTAPQKLPKFQKLQATKGVNLIMLILQV